MEVRCSPRGVNKIVRSRYFTTFGSKTIFLTIICYGSRTDIAGFDLFALIGALAWLSDQPLLAFLSYRCRRAREALALTNDSFLSFVVTYFWLEAVSGSSPLSLSSLLYVYALFLLGLRFPLRDLKFVSVHNGRKQARKPGIDFLEPGRI